MTLTTLIVTAVALSALGLRGESGMLQVLLVGGVVCTALSMSARSSPSTRSATGSARRRGAIEIANLARARCVASAATTAVILLMARVYGFSPGARPPAPAARAAAERDGRGAARRHGRRAARPGSSTASGGVFAVAARDVRRLRARLRARHVPADGAELAARLRGARSPGCCSAPRRTRRSPKARHEKGTLIASGFIAGGALVGVLAALLRFVEDSTKRTLVPDLTTLPALGPWVAAWGNWNGLVLFLLLGIGVYWHSRRAAA